MLIVIHHYNLGSEALAHCPSDAFNARGLIFGGLVIEIVQNWSDGCTLGPSRTSTSKCGPNFRRSGLFGYDGLAHAPDVL
jgi:hypothetical protein